MILARLLLLPFNIGENFFYFSYGGSIAQEEHTVGTIVGHGNQEKK
jgi:hypothetical protein